MSAKLLEQTQYLNINDEPIVIKPFTFGQLPRVAKALAAIASRVPADEGFSIPKLIAEGGEEILEVVAVAAGKSRDWLDEIDPADGFELVGAVVAANAEQFEKKILPAVAKLAATVATAAAGKAKKAR